MELHGRGKRGKLRRDMEAVGVTKGGGIFQGERWV